MGHQCWAHTATATRRNEIRESTAIIFKSTFRTAHFSFPLTPHWLELGHVAAPHCKGGWEMSLAGQLIIEERREDAIPRNNYQFLSFVRN